MAIVGEPCNADAHAKIPALFISMLCPCCVDTYTVQLYTLTVTVQLSHWPIRASHPSRGHHTHTHDTHTHKTQTKSNVEQTWKCCLSVPLAKLGQIFCSSKNSAFLPHYIYKKDKSGKNHIERTIWLRKAHEVSWHVEKIVSVYQLIRYDSLFLAIRVPQACLPCNYSHVCQHGGY